MPFRCDRCSPPKYFCDEHRLPVSHDCPGEEKWKKIKSSVSEIAIGYERGAGATVLAGSRCYFDAERISAKATTESIDEKPITYDLSEKPKSWFAKFKEKILKLFK
jgi:hypothetical protein